MVERLSNYSHGDVLAGKQHVRLRQQTPCKIVGAVTGVCPAAVTKLGLCPSQRVVGFAGHRAASLLPADYAP